MNDIARHEVRIDQGPALTQALNRLAGEFAGSFNRETIARLLDASYAEIAGRATVTNYLPLLAERFARQGLQAMARIEGRGDLRRPIVLFLCVHNAGRSQMALGFFQQHAGDAAIGWSGGSEPGNEVNAVAVAAMAERGVDITTEFPKPWTDEIVQAADVVVTMGCGEACPYFPGKRYEDWDLADPDGLDLDGVRPIRDEIERRVALLVAELTQTRV